MSIVRAGLALTALSLFACGGRTATDYDRAFAEGRRASSSGRFGDAAAAFSRSAKLATKERDRDHATLLAALEKSRAGDVAGALRDLDALAAQTPASSATEEAAFKAADLRRKTGSEAAGLAALDSFVTAHPESPFALPALAHVLRHADEQKTGDAVLARLASKVPEGTGVGQKLAFVRASRAEPAAAKVRAYVTLAERYPYPRGPYWDDALFAAATIENDEGHPKEAIALLTKLVAERETSDVIGSYQRPKLTPAKRLIAKIQAEKLHDRDAARKTLHELYATFTTSADRDDALWAEAKLFREDRREDDACSVLGTLVADFPDSRFVPCATASCPKVERPKKSRAPTTCHAYLLRDPAAAVAE